MTKKYHFRNLIVWQKAQDLAARLFQVVDAFPHTWAAEILAKQMLRSASSMGANIAEGHGRFSLKQYRYHLTIARGSAAETESWIFQAQKVGYIAGPKAQQLADHCEEIMRMLTSMILKLEKKIEQKAGAKRIREEPTPYVSEAYLTEDDFSCTLFSVLGSEFYSVCSGF